jgi:iron complex transport system substrate-binding protein
VYRDIQDIANAIHVPDKGREVVDELQAGFDSLEQNTSQAKRPSIMVQWWPKPVIAPGRQSWIHDMIERAGGHNPLGHEECKSRPLEDTEVTTLAPDAIVISWCGVKLEKYRPDVVYRNPTFANIPAIKNNRVYCISEEHMGRPSPRLLEGIRQLQAIVRECNQSPDTESRAT